jgi:hypothetical protein
MRVTKKYRRGKNENRQTHQQGLWSRGSRAGPTEDDPGKLLVRQSAEINEFWGENDASDFQKTDCQVFSATDFEQAYERTAAEEKEKFETASGRIETGKQRQS